MVFGVVVGFEVQVHFHGVEERFNEVFFDLVFVDNQLEGMQDRVEGDFGIYGLVGVFFEAIQKRLLVLIMKSVYDFICIPHKAIDGIDG